MKKKLSLIITGLFLLAGCTNSPVKPDITQKTVTQNNIETNSIFAGDVGKGQKGANLSIKFNFNKDSFNTKASANGKPALLVTDVKSAKVSISTSNTDPLNVLNLKFTSAILAFGGTTQIYTFTNVPAGTYYATVELYSDLGGTTNITEPIAYGGTTGTTGLTVSSNSCTVASPSMTFSFSDSATAFNLAPALLNAVGANLEAAITPLNGSNTPTNPIGAF